jgi:hypothetical protein
VTSTDFDYQDGRRINVHFSEQVGPSVQPNDLTITPTGGGAALNPASVGYDSSTRTATFTFNAPLPDGIYHAAISGISDGDANVMVADYAFDVFSLGGDANHDGVVNISDLLALATNWGVAGKTFAEGDFDRDGNVNSADLTILAGNWQRKADGTLMSDSAMPANLLPPPPAPVRPVRRTPTRLVERL